MKGMTSLDFAKSAFHACETFMSKCGKRDSISCAIPSALALFFFYITTYLGFIILAVSVIVLYKTRFGLRLRACGGLVFVITTSTNFNETVAGYGFLALAVMIFGQWKTAACTFCSILLRAYEDHIFNLFSDSYTCNSSNPKRRL